MNAVKDVKEGCVVEIGAYKGRSTVALGFGLLCNANSIKGFSVEPHADFVGPSGGVYGPANRVEYYVNVAESGVADRIALIGLPSAQAARAFDESSVAMLFVDGDHTYEGCCRDLAVWLPKMRLNGKIFLDDRELPGVKRAIDDFERAGQLRRVSAVGKIAECEVFTKADRPCISPAGIPQDE
jgi:hypothetical protein